MGIYSQHACSTRSPLSTCIEQSNRRKRRYPLSPSFLMLFFSFLSYPFLSSSFWLLNTGGRLCISVDFSRLLYFHLTWKNTRDWLWAWWKCDIPMLTGAECEIMHANKKWKVLCFECFLFSYVTWFSARTCSTSGWKDILYLGMLFSNFQIFKFFNFNIESKDWEQ